MAENEIILTEVPVVEESQDAVVQETVQVIEVEDVKLFEVDTDEAFPALGESNNQLNHAALNNRELHDQHPIEAITGLRSELDSIEALQTVYSNEHQQADYYLWMDENPKKENRDGLFVAVYGNQKKMKVCDSYEDVFGVTVAKAGFIGGQHYDVSTNKDGATIMTSREEDYRYGLVVHSGLAAVRCMSDVRVGDYVYPTNQGYATKSSSNYGYHVVAISNIGRVWYATISLSAPSTIARDTAKTIDDLSERMEAAEYNIVSTANVASDAYRMAQKASEVDMEKLEEQVEEIIDRMDKSDGVIGNLSDAIDKANTDAALARAIASSAVSSAETMRDEAIKNANASVANVNDLMEKYRPFDRWVDPETGNVSLSYAIRYISEEGNLSTKAEIEAVETRTENAFSSIEQNAKAISSLVATIDKYAVGEHSQAYGLTHEEAKAILKNGYVYVPTEDHYESYGDDQTTYFWKEYYYTWDGNKWAPSDDTAVFFINTYPAGSSTTPYWVVTDNDVTEGNVTYNLGGLYLWEDDAWTKVASVADNTMSRAVSNIKQTADSISASVTDLQGDFAGIEMSLSETQAQVKTAAEWTRGKSENGDILYNLATIDQSADQDGSRLALVVADMEGNQKLGGASIVLGQSPNEPSFIQLDAERINFTANDYNVLAQNINLTGKLTIQALESSLKSQIQNAPYYVKVEYGLSDSYNIWPGDYDWYEEEPAYDPRKPYMHRRVRVVYFNGDKVSDVVTEPKNSFSHVEVKYGLTENDNTVPADMSETDFEKVLETYNMCKKDNPYLSYCIYVSTTIVYTKTSEDDTNNKFIDARWWRASDSASDWCEFRDITMVDGSHIITGTIDADSLSVNKLSAISADMGTVNAGVIQSHGYNDIVVWGDEGSVGLVYELNDDGTYTVIGIAGGFDDSYIVIPKTYTDLSTGVEGLVTNIGDEAFANHINLRTVTIPDSITSIGSTAFGNCGLKSVTIPDSVTSIGEWAFSKCVNLTNVAIGDNVNSIGEYAFDGCSSLTNVVIGDGVTSIDAYAFNDCTGLTSLVIPVSVISIDANAFYNCTNLRNVYYKGTEEDWDSIRFDFQETQSTSATVYFYSATKPTEDGQFWHYNDENGFKISCERNMIDSKYFKVTLDGHTTATGGEIAGWDITEDSISKGTTKLLSSDNLMTTSLVDQSTTSPVRICVGKNDATLTKTKTITLPGHTGTQIDIDAGAMSIIGVDDVVLKMSNGESLPEFITFQIISFSTSRVSIGIENNGYGTITDEITILATCQVLPSFSVLDDGSLYASAAQISGHIDTGSGTIGGWDITEDAISKDTTILLSSDDIVFTSSLDQSTTSPLRIGIGDNVSNEMETTSKDCVFDCYFNGPGLGGKTSWYVELDTGHSYVYDVKVEFEIPNDDQDLTSLVKIRSVSINGGIIKVLFSCGTGANANELNGNNYTVYASYNFLPPFYVLEDGSLHASAAQISGNIDAYSGEIGPFTLTQSGLTLSQNNQTLSLSTRGIMLTGNPFSFSLGNINIKHESTTGTVLSTSGKLELKGENNTSILLMSDEASEEKTFDVTANFRTNPYLGGFGTDGVTFHCWGLNEAPYYPFTVTFWYEFSDGEAGEISTEYTPLNYGERDLQVGLKDTARYGKFRFKTKVSDWSSWYQAKQIQDDDTGWDGTVVGSSTQTKATDNIVIQGNLVPTLTGTYQLGDSERHWKVTYTDSILATTGTFSIVYDASGNVLHSDRNQKNTISPLSDDYELIFDKLQPVTFKYNNGTSDRLHTGFIAQDVRDATISAGLTTKDFAAYCEWDKEDGTTSCGLRYSEFISLCVDQIQKLKKRVETLENELKTQQSDYSSSNQ